MVLQTTQPDSCHVWQLSDCWSSALRCFFSPCVAAHCILKCSLRIFTSSASSVLFSYLLARSPWNADRRVYSKVASGAFDWPLESVSFAFAVAAVPVGALGGEQPRSAEWASERASGTSFSSQLSEKGWPTLPHTTFHTRGIGTEETNSEAKERRWRSGGVGGVQKKKRKKRLFYLFLSRG